MTSNPDQNKTRASLLVIEKECVSCYACVRECPAQAIAVNSQTSSVRIIPERCTACGSCYQICPTEAISHPSDLEKVKELLHKQEDLIALIDPSISAEFPDVSDYRSFIGMIKNLGFRFVCDVSFGADLVASAYSQLFSEFKGKYFITSKCPAVVNQILKYYPSLIENLAPILNPVYAMAKVVRERYGQDIPLIHMSPCLAIKNDTISGLSGEDIHGHLTFKELRQLFEDFSITEQQVEYQEFDPPAGRQGSLFPLTSGMMQAAKQLEDLIESNFHSSSGRSNMLDAVEEFKESNEIRKHLDLFYCEGCIMGPGMSPGGRKYKRQTLVRDYTKKRLQLSDQKEWEQHLEQYRHVDLMRTFEQDDQRFTEPEKSEIQKILKTIGKTEQDNVDKGCSACGYKSCKDFASAVALGLANVDMCQTLGTKNRQEYIQSLQVANDNLAKTKKALEESEKRAREEKRMVQAFSDTVSAVMQRIPSGVIISDKSLKIIQANQVMINLLGEEAMSINEVIPGLKGADIRKLLPSNLLQLFAYSIQSDEELMNKDVTIGSKILNLSVFPIQKGIAYGAIFRDMASPEVQKDEIIKRVTDTIDKNLEMVQKIGFLLGEGAAETEKMLNSIIQSFQSEDNK